MSETITRDEEIKGAVRKAYGDIARRFVEDGVEGPALSGVEGPATPQAGCCGPAEVAIEEQSQAGCCGPSEAPAQASCCGPSDVAVESTDGAARFYSAGELSGLPDSVTGASLGCGNPTAIADLRPGEVVLDLGSGGGIDCFLAARQVGPEGQVIGLDMTPDMIKLARRNAKKIEATNVDFRYGEMEEIPLPGESVDAIISNCVINLSPDKDAVFGEAHRVLRPGGRLSVSDIVVDGDLPQPVRDNLNAWAGCIAGALDERDYLGKIQAAGFEQVEVLSRDFADLEETVEWEEGQVVGSEQAEALLAETGLSVGDLARKVASIKVRAYKPA
jgi:arsenite methyltransferase